MELLEYYMIEAVMSEKGNIAILFRIMAPEAEEAYAIARRIEPEAVKYRCVGCVA